jgi:ubiquinone/menaquinone biosynthesis C-methylase UbiE
MNTAFQNMFDQLPGVYERINHIVSLGLDILRIRYSAGMKAAARNRPAH